MNKSFVFLFLILMGLGCIQKQETRWQTDDLIPLAYGTLNWYSFVADSLLEVDENNVLHLLVNKEVDGISLDSLVSIPDTSIHKSFEFPLPGGPYSIPPGINLIQLQENFDLQTQAVALREILLKSGKMAYTVRNYLQGDIVLEYLLPGVSLGSDQVNIQVNAGAGSPNNPTVVTGEMNLDGYHFDLTGVDGFSVNTLASSLLVKVDPNASQNAELSGGDSVVVEFIFQDPVIEYARGYFGQYHFDVFDSLDVASLTKLTGTALALSTMSLHVKMENFVGVDLQVGLNSLLSHNTASGQDVTLENSQINEILNLSRAQDLGGYVSSTSLDISLDETNSNILDFMGNFPDKITFDLSSEVNPLGDISTGNDFVYTDKTLKTTLEADLPLCLGLENITLTDTLEIMSSTSSSAYGTLLVYASNSFPFSADFSLDLIDEQGNFISNLADHVWLESALFDAYNLSTTAVESIIEINLKSGVAEMLTDPNRLVVNLAASTYNGSEVKLTQDQGISLKIVAHAFLEIGYP